MHTPNMIDYGLYALLAVLVIKELFALVRWAFSMRNGFERRRANPNGGCVAMPGHEMRGYLQTIASRLELMRDTQTANAAKLEQILSNSNRLLGGRT